MEVEGGAEMASTLKEENQNKVKGLEVAARNSEATLYDLGVDVATREDEVMIALKEVTQIDAEDIIKTKSIRPGI